VKLLGYSTDTEGRPCPDPVDGTMYIVTELAKCTLGDHLKLVVQNATKTEINESRVDDALPKIVKAASTASTESPIRWRARATRWRAWASRCRTRATRWRARASTARSESGVSSQDKECCSLASNSMVPRFASSSLEWTESEIYESRVDEAQFKIFQAGSAASTESLLSTASAESGVSSQDNECCPRASSSFLVPSISNSSLEWTESEINESRVVDAQPKIVKAASTSRSRCATPKSKRNSSQRRLRRSRCATPKPKSIKTGIYEPMQMRNSSLEWTESEINESRVDDAQPKTVKAASAACPLAPNAMVPCCGNARLEWTESEIYESRVDDAQLKIFQAGSAASTESLLSTASAESGVSSQDNECCPPASSSFLVPALSQTRPVVGKYVFSGSMKTILGKGTTSICYLGCDIETGERVAIKEFGYSDVSLASLRSLAGFRRQVDVLLELQQPFNKPANWAHWCQELDGIDPSDLFVKLLDYSKDAEGRPGPDPVDGTMHIVTELAKCTLEDHLNLHRQKATKPSTERVRRSAQEILLATAGLHAKGFVHLDLKPANVMMCKGRWKLIGMDGCIRIGTEISPSDPSVLFTPIYCAPEFARFVQGSSSLVVSPCLDAWSAGMTAAELVNLRPVLRAQHPEMPAPGGSDHLLRWLGSVRVLPLPVRMEARDRDFSALLSAFLLEPEAAHRKTLAQTLAAPYFHPAG